MRRLVLIIFTCTLAIPQEGFALRPMATVKTDMSQMVEGPAHSSGGRERISKLVSEIRRMLSNLVIVKMTLIPYQEIVRDYTILLRPRSAVLTAINSAA